MFNNVIPAAQQGYGNMQQLNQIAQQAQARAALAKVLQQIAARQGQQQAPAGAQPAPMYGSQLPGATPSAAVSPQTAGAPAATGGAPGGAGPLPAMPGGGASSFFGIDPAIVQALGQQNISPGAMGYAIENAANLSKAPTANATRLEIAGTAEQGRNQRAQLSASTRMQIANQTAAYRRQAAAAAPKLKDDAEFRTLEDELNGAKTLYNASPTDDNLQAYHEAAKALSEYSRTKTTGAAPAASPALAPAPAPAAAPAAGGTVSVVDPNGTPGTIPADQLQDALKQGYKQVQ